MKKNKSNIAMVVAGIFGMLFAAGAFGNQDYLASTVEAILSLCLIMAFRK